MYDKLIKNLRETDFSDGCPCGAENLCKDNDCLIWQAADAIEKLQKRKHGKWINQRPDSEMCSACGVRFYISALFSVGGNEEPNFCPNCGADMREETEDIPMEYFESGGK